MEEEEEKNRRQEKKRKRSKAPTMLSYASCAPLKANAASSDK
jgi:hypothetical protein